MKLISYNINGIRSALNKNITSWLQSANADMVCFQEVKARPDQFDTFLFKTMGYELYIHPAEKKGYSGVAILSRHKPENYIEGCGNPIIDFEGRIQRFDLNGITFINVYMPSGSSGDERQAFKMKFLDYFYDFIACLKKERPKLVISGDFNICHQPIDIHDPVRNAKSSGFLPEEREWMSKFLELGFIDTFRELNPDKVKYSWWSFRSAARKRNKGWRIDYNMVSTELRENLIEADMLNDVVHSDHCPVFLNFEC